MSKIKIIFIGTPEFGAIVLKELIKGGCKPVLVITAPDEPVGRKQILTSPPVKLLAKKYKINAIQPAKIQNSKLEIKKLEPDLIVVAAYSQILSKKILEIPKYGCLNLHPSLLPKYRGPSPIQSAILNGDKESGAAIIKMTDKVDAGPVVAQEKINLEGSETYEILHNKLAGLGANLLLETMPKWIKNKIKPRPQNDRKATWTKVLKKEDGKINWQKSAEEIERQVRAFCPWPGSYAFWENKDKLIKIKTLKTRTFKSPHKADYPLGKILVVPQNEIGVQCGKDFLVIEKLQMEGGKEMGSEEFLRGHLNFIGTILK